MMMSQMKTSLQPKDHACYRDEEEDEEEEQAIKVVDPVNYFQCEEKYEPPKNMTSNAAALSTRAKRSGRFFIVCRNAFSYNIESDK